MGIKADYW